MVSENMVFHLTDIDSNEHTHSSVQWVLQCGPYISGHLDLPHVNTQLSVE